MNYGCGSSFWVRIANPRYRGLLCGHELWLWLIVLGTDCKSALSGFSRDGKVEIHFYLNNDGTIGSYFPKKR
jgi:hypothetical protein